VRDNLRMGVAAHDMDEDAAIDRVLADFPRLVRLLDRDGGACRGASSNCWRWRAA
jgi:amidase